MKKLALISLALGVFAAALSSVSALVFPMKGASPQEAAPAPAPSAAAPSYPEPPSGEGGVLPFAGEGDSRAVVRVKFGDEARELSMFEYLVGVVAGEMPASFEPEALRAQATAARTYALYGVFVSAPGSHPEADVCSDPGCCAAFASDVSLREGWGGDYDANISKIRSAVASTDGVYITYGSEPILAAFHSSSYGSTENAEDVWLGARPYLVSVPSPETEEDVPGLISTVTVSPEDFKATATAALPDAVFGHDAGTWITDVTEDRAGRVATLKIGGVPVTGAKLRALFGLRSTAVSVRVDASGDGGADVVFTTAGHGHGVGMSQYGANAMAKSGAGWRDIIKAYYTGAELSDEVFVETVKL
ncbi:MAG: stage II sporulation protein D [Oscillospiraceae bacterium]|jgi:stage II sporulation protein D|nr:stage II sporulation protein D [Oscillospiraceae bacterium]